jgi:hypothetical protein
VSRQLVYLYAIFPDRYTIPLPTGIYITYNPFPLVLLTDIAKGTQDVHIAPLAHEIASSVFGEEVKFWEDALGRPLQVAN